MQLLSSEGLFTVQLVLILFKPKINACHVIKILQVEKTLELLRVAMRACGAYTAHSVGRSFGVICRVPRSIAFSEDDCRVCCGVAAEMGHLGGGDQ